MLTRVEGIPMEKEKKRNFAMKAATVTCAALIGVFAMTNGVCYAATGETWVEKATVWVNDKPVEVDVQMSQNGDTTIGTVEYTVDDEDGGQIDLSMTVEGGSIDDAEITINDYAKGNYQVQEGEDGNIVLSSDGEE